MSADLLTDDDLATKRAPVKEPSKRWRIWYVALANCRGLNRTTGTVEYRREGERWLSAAVYPSREVAEHVGREIEHRNKTTRRGLICFDGVHAETD